MKLLNRFTLMMSITALLCMYSCDDDDTIYTQSSGIKYVVTLRNQASSESTADYLLTTDDLMSGEITAEGQGIELNGWNYVGSYGNKYFAFDYTDNICYGYSIIDSTLELQGQISYDAMDMFAPIDDETFLAIGAPWGGGSYNCQLQFVDIENVGISKTIENPLYESYYSDADTTYQLNAWPTYAYQEDDKLFVFFYTMNGSTWATPNTDTAYCSIFSYPGIEYLKTIKDSRTSAIGYYSSQPCVVEDDEGNHYTFSSSSYGAGFTQATKPSGILKINAGETSFDEDYFFNVEDNYGYKVLSGAYAGNGKAVVSVISTENDTEDNVWGASSASNPIVKTAVIDLENQTFTLINDIPTHGGQGQTPYLLEDNMVYISINDGTNAHVYEVNASTATATQGAEIIGNELQGIFLNE